jgi:hypothetical protein
MTTSTCPPPEGGSSAGRKAALVGVAALASLFLAACGGDSDMPAPPPPPPTPVTQVPASAGASEMALEAYAFNLPQTDNTEPLSLDLLPATLPGSETSDPIPTP